MTNFKALSSKSYGEFGGTGVSPVHDKSLRGGRDARPTKLFIIYGWAEGPCKIALIKTRRTYPLSPRFGGRGEGGEKTFSNEYMCSRLLNR
jgi:hypothetical protein